MKKIYMIGNTHFDPVWLWTWDEAMASIRSTFRSALDRMKEDPNFTYTFATPPVFEWIKEVDPEMFEEIKQRVTEGRWEVAEGWWVQPDCYSAMGESYVRHGLYGQKYLKENFSKVSKTVFNIDSFGHSPMLPQILAKSHIKYYCFVRPEERYMKLDSPLFQWKSQDGSSVLAYRFDDVFSNDLSKSMENAKESPCETMMVYGVTNHGGAPTKKMIAQINENDHTVFSGVEHYFEQNNTPSYEKKGELLTGDFGPFANCMGIKKLNRIAEYALLNAEKISVFSKKDHKTALEDCWKSVLFNQFHDILGGASIKPAFVDAQNLYGSAISRANDMLHKGLQYLTKNIQMPGNNEENAWNLVVWNLNSTPYHGYLEAEAQWVHEFEWYEKGLELRASDGTIVPCQIIRELSVIPGFRSRFVCKVEVPPFGYKAFAVMQNGKDLPVAKQNDLFHIKTNKFSIQLSKEDGSIIHLSDVTTNKTICENIIKPVCYGDHGDTWCFNIEDYENEAEHFKLVKSQLIEQGELRTVIKYILSYRQSLLDLYYTFYQEECYFDVRYRINWNEKHMVVKLLNQVEQMEHQCSVPYGSVTRTEFVGDQPMGEWVKAGELSFLTDSIFAYSFKDSHVGLTLLRSPIYGDLRIREIDLSADYEIMEQGINEGKIRVTFEEDVPSQSVSFNNPPIVVLEANHAGNLPGEYSYCSSNAKHTMITVLKQSEYSNNIIIRMVEYSGQPEEWILSIQGKDYPISIGSFEIKTIKIDEEKMEEVFMTEF